MRTANHLLVFALDGQRYALRLSAVERVLRAVAVTPLPQTPEVVLGVVNVHGRILPVLDIRRRFHLPLRDLELSDRFIVARTARRPVILVVDDALGVVECTPQDVTTAGTVLPGAEYLEGVVRLTDGMVFIHNLDSFLSLGEEQTLQHALTGD
jgi:purine-binding chemotaxis protein CheW